MSDVVVVNKVDSASAEAVAEVVAKVLSVNPRARIVKAASPVTLEEGPPLAGAKVLVVEDGPTITHGEMPYGAGAVAAHQAGTTNLGRPTLADVLQPFVQEHRRELVGAGATNGDRG